MATPFVLDVSILADRVANPSAAFEQGLESRVIFAQRLYWEAGSVAWHGREGRPGAGDAFELVLAAWLELEP